MQEITSTKLALAAAWAMLPTLGGVLGFIALERYEYLLISAVTGYVAWSMLSVKRSRRIFIACAVLSAAVGVICHLGFSRPDGNINGMGIMLFLLPAMAINVFLVLRIYFIEIEGDKHP